MSIVNNLLLAFKSIPFTLREAYALCPEVHEASVRARIYEGLGQDFVRLGRGLYRTIECDAVIIEGDGRDLSILEDQSIDCIITDHPWGDGSNYGGNRNFAAYECFRYTAKDFEEKARVLKDGSFLCECLPAENESNFDYLYEIKKMAEAAGFKYYCKVPWKKGTFVSNTGRNAKCFEDIMIFSKGKPRALRPDKQHDLRNGEPTRFMSGANGMLPGMFDIQAVPRGQQIAQSEKPCGLFEQLLEYLTRKDEIVLDQFAGSGAVGAACMKRSRKCILIEKSKELVSKICHRLQAREVVINNC